MAMVLYSLLLGAVLAASAPVWGWRMLRQGRYRAGLRQRLGTIPATVAATAQGRRVVWVHAVSVGEVLAVERLVRELGEALGPAWVVLVSTTTETAQTIAAERFGAGRVLYWPLDFAWIVRRLLSVLRPEMLILVESELWPRMLRECRARGVPVAVVNARMSDRSFRRAMRVPGLWRWMTAGVPVFFAQGQETAGRLRALGASEVRVLGNLKFDLQPVRANALSAQIGEMAQGRKLVVAGSTLPGEELLVLRAWRTVLETDPCALLVFAPRHTPRFSEVAQLLRAEGWSFVAASQGLCALDDRNVVLLDTLGDLASVYGVADVALIGGSLVPRGGHNPLEAARFGVPVLMGPSYENFREIVDGMLEEDAIAVVQPDKLAWGLTYLLQHGAESGRRGQMFFEAQAGATARTVQALRELLDA